MRDFFMRIARGVDDRRKVAIPIIVFIVIIAGWGILVGLGMLQRPDFLRRHVRIADTRPTPRNAFDIAVAHARQWQSDALLAFMNSGAVGETGRSDTWKIGFVSKSKTGVAYIVEVRGYEIFSKIEIPYSGSGAEFPPDIISQEEAIVQMRQIRGYENLPIVGVEAIYGPAGKIWYWGVKTSKGVVSIEARKK